MRYFQTIIICAFLCLSFTNISSGKNSRISDDAGSIGLDNINYVIAHHVGNRPDWASDIDDQVHGGDNSNGAMDSDYDPNGDNPPEPEGRPEEPGDGGGNDNNDND